SQLLRSFPTRRSSDLFRQGAGGREVGRRSRLLVAAIILFPLQIIVGQHSKLVIEAEAKAEIGLVAQGERTGHIVFELVGQGVGRSEEHTSELQSREHL